MRVLTVPVAAVLLFAVCAPALWRMDCLASERTLTSWAQAESCMPEAPAPDVPAVDNWCCVFTVVQGELSELHQTAVTALPALPVYAVPAHVPGPFIAQARTVVPPAVAHAPPLPPSDAVVVLGRFRV